MLITIASIADYVNSFKLFYRVSVLNWCCQALAEAGAFRPW